MTTLPATRSRAQEALGARLGLLQISIAGILWGTTGVVVRTIRDHTGMSPISIGFYRLLFSALVLIVFSARHWRRMLAATVRHPLACAVSGVGLGIYQALYFVAVADVGVTVSTIVSLGIAPVVLAGWEAVGARCMPGPQTLGILSAAISGLALVSLAGTHTSQAAPHPVLGVFAAVGSGLGYGITTAVNRHVSQTTAALDLTTVSSAIGALTLAPLAIIAGAALPRDAGSVAGLIYIGVISTALGYGLFYGGLRTTPGSVATVLSLLEALTAAVLATLILHEPMPLTSVVGGTLLMAAIAALYLLPTARLR